MECGKNVVSIAGNHSKGAIDEIFTIRRTGKHSENPIWAGNDQFSPVVRSCPYIVVNEASANIRYLPLPPILALPTSWRQFQRRRNVCRECKPPCCIFVSFRNRGDFHPSATDEPLINRKDMVSVFEIRLGILLLLAAFTEDTAIYFKSEKTSDLPSGSNRGIDVRCYQA